MNPLSRQQNISLQKNMFFSLKIQEGLAQIATAQGNVVLAQQMAERNPSLMEAIHHWKRDEGRLWRDQQDMLNPPQALKTMLNPPAQPPRMTQLSPGQSEALSDRTETSGAEDPGSRYGHKEERNTYFRCFVGIP